MKYYCLVDPDTDSAEIFVLKRENYKKADTFKEGKIRLELGHCSLEFDFSQIFN